MDFFPILVDSEEVRCIHVEERKGNHPALLVSGRICEKQMHITYPASGRALYTVCMIFLVLLSCLAVDQQDLYHPYCDCNQ